MSTTTFDPALQTTLDWYGTTVAVDDIVTIEFVVEDRYGQSRHTISRGQTESLGDWAALIVHADSYTTDDVEGCYENSALTAWLNLNEEWHFRGGPINSNPEVESAINTVMSAAAALTDDQRKRLASLLS